jgi:hypothetical protein
MLEGNMRINYIKLCLHLAVISLASVQYAWSNAVYDINKGELIVNAVDVGGDVMEARLITTDIKTFTLTSAKLVTNKSGAHAVYDPSNTVVSFPFVKAALNLRRPHLFSG